MRLRTVNGVLSLVMLACVGCTSTSSSDTARTGMEQLLISNAIDQSLDKVDFRALERQSVFIDQSFLECTDQKYLLSSLRHRVVRAGGELAPSAEAASVVLEVRSGGVGTDRYKSFIGMPEISVPGPMPVALPEIRLFERSRQTGTAKIGIVAYDAKTHLPLGEGGVSMARSDDNNWYLLGMGPYQQGTVRKEVTNSLSRGSMAQPLPAQVALRPPAAVPAESRVRLAGADESGGPAEAPQQALAPAASWPQ